MAQPRVRKPSPGAHTCRNVLSGVTSANATLTNYQGRSGSWPYDRLWIGSTASAPDYHGNYCSECVVTWKRSNGSDTGVYSPLTSNTSNARNGVFWIR